VIVTTTEESKEDEAALVYTDGRVDKDVAGTIYCGVKVVFFARRIDVGVGFVPAESGTGTTTGSFCQGGRHGQQ
jgi:hypothetical protein